MASENIGSLYNTKMPGYEDAADIQAALKLYHYGSETYNTANTNPSQLPIPSMAHHLHTLQTEIDGIDSRGIGSEFSQSLPSDPADGYIWVDADSSPALSLGKNWVLKQSGSLSGTSITVEDLSGQKFFIVMQDWSHNSSATPAKLVIRFNGDLATRYVNTGGLTSANALYSPEFDSSDTQDITISVDLANTASLLKPVSTIASTEAGQYFGYYRNSDHIESIFIGLDQSASFDGGSYQVWSYE
jgi:hypothetical protein